MPTITIFIASSNELEVDRKAFADFLYERSKLWVEDRDTFLKLHNWEDFIDAMSKTRLQDEYNKAIAESDIFVMLFWTKVGKYTHEEFDVAWKLFQDKDKPLIYTYFKNAPAAGPLEPSLEAFKKKLLGLGHFVTEYKNTEGLLLHFSAQLDKLYRIKVTAVPPAEATKNRDEIVALINKGQLFEAFEELKKIFGEKNDSLNVLMNEFINPPNNFSQANFLGRLKIFLLQHL